MKGNKGHTQLFLLGLWLDETPQDRGENGSSARGRAFRWHGKVQHIIRGESHAFNGWEMMIDCLEAMLLRDTSERAKARQVDGRLAQVETKASITRKGV